MVNVTAILPISVRAVNILIAPVTAAPALEEEPAIIPRVNVTVILITVATAVSLSV
jgi:hypothetical protein